MEATPKHTTLDTITFRGLLLFIFLLPFFVVPTLSGSKTFFVLLCTLALLIMYTISVLREGQVLSYPHTNVFFAGLGVVLIHTIAAFLSEVSHVSFMGATFELTTVAFVTTLFVLLFLVTRFFNTPQRIFHGHLAFFISVLLLAFFHMLRLFVGIDFASLDFLTTVGDNTVGVWNELILFCAAGIVLVVVTLEEFVLRPMIRVCLWSMLIVGLALLATTNFMLMWYLLGVVAGLYLIAKLVQRHTAETAPKRFPIHALGLVLISLSFIVAGSGISDALSNHFGLTVLDVRPGWQATNEVVSGTLAETPLFGAGPNRFVNEWVSFKPEGINETDFWNADFQYGVGLIPSFFVTTGLVGGISWLLLIGALIYTGVRSLFVRRVPQALQYLLHTSFCISVFLWLVALFYVPGVTLFTLTFIFTGLFLATLTCGGVMEERKYIFASTPRGRVIAMVLLVSVLMTSIVFGYGVIKRIRATALTAQGTASLQAGNLTETEHAFTRALILSRTDVAARRLSQVHLAHADTIVAGVNGQELSEAQSTQLMQALQASIDAALYAARRDPTNYQNHQNLGRISQQAAAYGVSGAHEGAQEAYAEARALNPTNPALLLDLARLELVNGDVARSREYIAEARELKWNYTDAMLILAQIEAGEGDTEATIAYIEEAISVSPSDPALWFQLGLSYYEVGRHREAVQVFEHLTELLPDNESVAEMLRRLENNEPPLDTVSTPTEEELPSEDSDEIVEE